MASATEHLPFPGGREILAWFGSLRPVDRLDLITRVQTRQQHLRSQILTATVLHASPIQDASEAQLLVALEAFYRTALPLLNAQHLTLRRSSRLDNREAIKRHLGEFRREYACLGPLIHAGDWRPLKQKWLAAIEGLEPPHLRQVEATDPIERLEQ